jgi:DNA-binding NarL/FixJ family response regulator
MAGALVSLGIIQLDMCAFVEAEHTLTQGLARAREVSSTNFIRVASGGLAGSLIGQRRLKDAAAVLEAILEPSVPMQTAGQRLCWLTWAELQLARGEAAAARETIERVIDTGRTPWSGAGVAARVEHLRGEALAAVGETAQSLEALQNALAVANELGARGRSWRIRASLARVLRSLARREEADKVLGAARATLQELALEIDDPALRETFVRATSAIVPPAPAATPARATKQRFGGLTGREREVAALIARGRSNRAIADQLVLGERTIESYVGNILSKFGFTSRAQIAAWAVESGLVAAAGESDPDD